MGGLVALAFSDAPQSLREYVKKIMEAEGIIVDMESEADEDGCLIAELSISLSAAAEQAEKIGLGKKCNDGNVLPFMVTKKKDFEGADTDSIFSEAEMIMMLWQIIYMIEADSSVFEGVRDDEKLIDWLKRNGHLDDCFPLHNAKTIGGFLKDLKIYKPWLSDEMVGRMKDYFGDRVALYFAFISTYTTCLMTYSIIGMLVFVVQFIEPLKPLMNFTFGIFAAFWSTWMLQRWYQRNIKLIFDWRGIVLGDGTDELLFSKRLVEDIRPEFIGEWAEDEITGEYRPHVSKEDTARRQRFSYAMMLLYFLVAARVIFWVFSFEDNVKDWLADEDDEFVFLKVFPLTLVFQNIPMVVFIVVMMLLDTVFGKVADKLTNYENHLLQRDHSNSLTTKLTGFQFLNTFGVFLYIAFIRKDAAVLQTRIQNLFLVELVIGNVKETIIPIVQRAFRSMQKTMDKEEAMAAKKKTDGDESTEQSAADGSAEKPKTDLKTSMKKYANKPFLTKLWQHTKAQVLAPKEPIEEIPDISARDQLELDEAEDNADDDYFEMYRQLGMITLFAVSWPLGALFATFNNCIEIYSDFLKLVRNSKRPIPRREISSGAWLDAMQGLSLFSFITNLLLVFHTTTDGGELFKMGLTQRYLFAIFLQQMMLAARSSYVSATSRIPDSITVPKARIAFLQRYGK